MTWTQAATACTTYTAATGLHWTVKGSDATGWYTTCLGAYGAKACAQKCGGMTTGALGTCTTCLTALTDTFWAAYDQEEAA